MLVDHFYSIDDSIRSNFNNLKRQIKRDITALNSKKKFIQKQKFPPKKQKKKKP